MKGDKSCGRIKLMSISSDDMKVLSLFSGIGAFEKALSRRKIPFEVVGFSEIDKYAVRSYCAVHGVSEKLNLGDITKIDLDSLPEADLITHGSPCQDFSVAGIGRGGDVDSNTRSSLMWNSVEIIGRIRPKYVIWENVKNVLSKKHKHNFDKYLQELKKLGYTNYYKVLNAKDYGVPQNRERIFCISILGNHTPYIFPDGFDNGVRLKDILENNVDEKYYISEEKTSKLIQEIKTDKLGLILSNQATKLDQEVDTANTLLARDYKGFGNQGMNAVAVPCITPDRLEKRQNGRRFKDDGDPMFTLTSQDRHGVLTSTRLGGIFDGETKHQAGSVWDTNGLAPTLDTMQGGYRQPCIIEDSE